MILRIILIAILIYLFIRISKRLIAGVKEVTGSGKKQTFKQNYSTGNTQKSRGFDSIEDAEFEEVKNSDDKQ